jgi:hypothetical protein
MELPEGLERLGLEVYYDFSCGAKGFRRGKYLSLSIHAGTGVQGFLGAIYNF